VTFKIGMRIALRRHKLPPESVALFLEYEGKRKAEQERQRLERHAKGIKTEYEKMEEGVGKVATEMMELRQCVDTLKYELGTQAEELKAQNQQSLAVAQLSSEVHLLKEGMADLEHRLKAILAHTSPLRTS
jgi:phage shock protein A